MRVDRKVVPFTPNPAHSDVVGGSSARLRLKCSASRVECAKVPNDVGIEADEGTALHHVTEIAITEDLLNDEVMAQFRGVVLKIDDMVYDIKVTEDHLQSKVFAALDFFDRTVPKDAKVFVEAKVGWQLKGELERTRASSFLDIRKGFGTGDVGYYNEDIAGGIDWKFGDGIIVGEKGREQGAFYLVGLIMRGILPIRDKYEWWFFQPAKKLDPDQYATRIEYTWEELVDFNHDLHDAVTSPPKHTPGEHCYGCRGKIVCKAFQQFVNGVEATDVEGLSLSELGRMYEMAGALAKLAEQIKETAKRNANEGRIIPGYGLDEDEGPREWKDEDAAEAALGRYGVPPKDRRVTKLISAPQAMEKLKKMGTPEDKLARFADTHIRRPKRGMKLVRLKPNEDKASKLRQRAKQIRAKIGG